jgi:hypothetical protein
VATTTTSAPAGSRLGCDCSPAGPQLAAAAAAGQQPRGAPETGTTSEIIYLHNSIAGCSRSPNPRAQFEPIVVVRTAPSRISADSLAEPRRSFDSVTLGARAAPPPPHHFAPLSKPAPCPYWSGTRPPAPLANCKARVARLQATARRPSSAQQRPGGGGLVWPAWTSANYCRPSWSRWQAAVR